jgi:hypothetical protein
LRLPLYTQREEAVPVRAAERIPLPRVLALVSAGHPEVLEIFVQGLRDVAAAGQRPLRVLRVSQGAFAIDEVSMKAKVDEASAQSFADALALAPTVTIGALVPALFVPALTLAFSSGSQASALPAAAREVRDCIDGIFPDARPGLVRNLFETSIFAM